MSLTNYQIKDLAKRMGFNLEGCFFKDELPSKLKYNTAYIINLEDEFDENGEQNNGSHWTCFQLFKYPNDKVDGIYFDSYAKGPPKDVENAIINTINKKIPYTTKPIQGLMNNACGWYCCAFLHWINSSQYRSKDLFLDVSQFLEMFDDLEKVVDFKKNEFILKHFFRSSDPSKRRPIDVESISKDNTGNGPDIMKIPVSAKEKV
jgi:hypothetical protein